MASVYKKGGRWWVRFEGAARAPQLEDGRAVAIEPQPPTRVLPSPLRHRVDALRRLVDGPEPRQPTRAAEVQGAEAQAPDGCGGRRAARPGRARPRVATALRDRILSWPPPR